MTNKFSCFLTQKGRWLTATLFILFSLSIGQMWATSTTYTYTGYTTQIANGWTHNYGNTYVGRKGSNYTPDAGGLPTGNGNIFAAFQVSAKSKIRVVFVWTKTNGDLTGKSIALASLNKETYDKLVTASTGTGNDVKYSISDFSSSQSKAVAINRANANEEITFEFDNAVSAGYYAVYTASSINGSALIKKIIVVPTHTLTWDFDGGSSSATAGEDYTAGGDVAEGATITYPLASTMSKSESEFDGWSSNATTMPTSNLTITAQWSTAGPATPTHSVTAASNNALYGSAAAASGTVAEGSTTTITATPESGYRFVSWAVEGTGASLSSTSTNPTTLTMGTADATVTATFEVIPTHTISYTNTKEMDNSANPTSYTEGVGVASFTKLRHAEGYDFTGWSPSSISNTATTDQTIEAQWTANAVAEGTGTLTYALAFGSGSITTTSITRDNGALYDATDVSLTHTSFADNANKTGCSGKLTTTTNKDNNNYVEVTFKVANGYTFTPTEVRVQGIAVTNDKAIEVELKDNASTPHGKSVSGTLAQNSSPVEGGYTVTLDFDATGEVALEGTVTAKIFAYGDNNKHWRMGTPLVITGTVAEKAACAAPTAVTIAATEAEGNYGWRYTPGETIDLTCSYTGGTGTPSYQWQKWDGTLNDWANVAGATTARLQIENCTSGDGGSYRCVVSTGTSCSLASDGYFVRVFTLNGNYNNDAWTENAITWTGETTGTVTLHLNESSLYQFKVTDNDNKWFGYNENNYIIYPVDWNCGVENHNCRLFTASEGDYVITINVANAGAVTPIVNMQVAYPSVTHPAAGYVYFAKGTYTWANVAAHWWYWDDPTATNFIAWENNPWMTQSVEICNTTYYYMPKLAGYNRVIFHNPEASGEGTQTSDITVDASSSGKYILGTSTEWAAFATYTISFAGNGNTSGEMSDIASICPTTDQALTANAFAKTGYNFAGWVADVDVTVGDETITAGNLIANEATLKNITSNIALTAQWAIDCPASGTLFSASVAATSKQSIPASTSDLALTASQATVTGGTMSVYNAQTKEKDLIADNSSTYYFTETNNDTYFKIKLDCALEEGDIIQIDAVGGTRVKEEVTYELGLWVSTATSRPGSAPACAGTSSESTLVSKMINYQVQDGDEYEGKSTLYIYRAYGATQYFGDITITRPEKFTVTYWKNDETTDKTVDDNAAVVADNEFTRSGYRFIEWNTQADGKGTTKAVGAAVTADIELYAIWAQEFTVSYANTGAASGDAPTNENKYITGETFKVAGIGTMVAAADHAFGGWNDGSTTYQEDDDYTVGTANVSFTPVWNETFNVYYYPNGGSGTAYTAEDVTTVNECFFAPAAGKLFDKWTTHEDGTGDVYAPGAAVTTSINLYAQWKDDECTARQSLIAVTFTGETAATAVVNGYNEKEYASAALINKLGDNSGPSNGGYKIYGDGGYIFATIAKGDFQEGDKLEVEVTVVPGSQKLDVYAYGDDIATAYKVVSIEQVSAAGTYSYALTAANATAINALGYKSLGIYRATGSNMNAYVKSLSIKGCRSWVIKHDVTFDLNGQTGSAPAAQSIEEGGLVTKPADPEVDGQFFRGWFTDEECTAGNEWDFANDVVGTTDVVLYAKWEADPCDNRRSIVKAVMASTTTATVTGYNENEYAGGYLISGLGTGSNQNTYDFGEGDVTGYKLAVDGSSIIMATLAKGGFAEGDKVTIAVTKAADGGKLPIYAAKDKNNVVSIANIDVTSPGIYTYTLTAANIATIEAAGEGYMSIGAYRGSYNPFIYSVELTGCRNWSVYHTLTFAKEDDTEIAAEQLAEGVYASTVAPKAPRVSGYHFLGWSTTKNDADAIVNLAEYTITTDKTLYAVYAANDCSGNGVMFSMTPVANELADDYAPKGDVERDYSDYATLSGGEVYINNVAATDTRIKVFKTSSNIQLCGGENAYIHVLLDCPLHEDDTIKIENDQAWKISLTKNDGYVNKAKADKYHIVPAAWADKDEFYIRRGGSNLTVSGLKVIRPAKYTVSFDMKGHGIAPADIENVLDGSKITAPTAPTDEDYSFAGWYKETTLENAWDFANDVVNANTTLYAKWLDKSDATLKSLKYGETEIIEVGTYTYNIDLPSKTASVPALTAETNNPNAAKLITNAETFNVDGEATSTVVVTPEAGTPVTYTVNFSKLPDMPLLDVTASTTWNFANAAAYNSTFTDEVLANFPGMPDASVFDAQRLQASGAKIKDGYLQGTPVKFHTTTPGKVRVEFSNTGGGDRPYRNLLINGNSTGSKSNGTAHVTSAWITVPAGDVIISGLNDNTEQSNNLNFYKIEFDATPDLTRPATPGRYGTICYPTAGYFVGGTLYEIAYYDATAEKIFLDEIINGEMIADRPYVFLPNDGVTEVGMIYSEDERAEVTAGKFNGLHGTYVALSSSNTTESPLWNNYLISNNQYICVTGSNCTLSKNRAYIVMSEMTTTPTEPRHGRRRVAIGAAPKTATDIENIVGGETPVKLMINGQMYILRGEKLYDATGRLVK